MSAPPADRPRPVLIVLHQEHSQPGRVGAMLRERGHALDIRRPRFGDPLPETLAEHAGAVIFGGPMSANDEEDWIRREIDWLAVPLREEKPFFGICLGAQMLVRHLGGRVAPHPENYMECGYYPLRPTPEGARLMRWPEQVYHFHREGFDLPSGAALLAEGDLFPNQAFLVGPNAFGIQFHPELTWAMMHRWCTRGAHRLSEPGAQPRHAHFDGRFRHDAAKRAWLAEFLDLWLSGRVEAGPRSATAAGRPTPAEPDQDTAERPIGELAPAG